MSETVFTKVDYDLGLLVDLSANFQKSTGMKGYNQ